MADLLASSPAQSEIVAIGWTNSLPTGQLQFAPERALRVAQIGQPAPGTENTVEMWFK
jgi:hypothetical protein